MNKQKHVPVLAQEVLAWLDPSPGESYLDLTAGYGGHAQLVREHIGDNGSMTLVDRDEEAAAHLKELFADEPRVEVIQQDFLAASRELLAKGRKYDMILADLGVSSPHLDNPERGFSFARSGPLDMRMDKSQQLTAAEIVNTYEPDELASILRNFGEVKNAHKIARLITENRPYESTADLAKKIVQFAGRKKRTHPATEIFQAIRIAVNNELGLLEESLPLWVKLLNTRGRIGVISFHSLEDRLVKQAFRDFGGNRYDAKLQIVTKQVITGSDEEVVFNPRARSAKLRVAQRK